MESIRLGLLLLHFVGLAALLGGFMAQLRGHRRVMPVMVHGAIAQLVTGIALVGVRENLDLDTDDGKIAVKLAIATAALAAAILGRRERPTAGRYFYAAGLFAVANIAVAVFWT